MERAIVASSLVLALFGCAPPKQSGSDPSANVSTAPSVVARTPTGTPMDKSPRQMRIDFQQIFDCTDPDLKRSCYPNSPEQPAISIETDKDGRIDTIWVPITTKVLDGNGKFHDVAKSDVGYKLLRYIFPQWRSSKDWLDRRYDIARKKDSGQECPAAAFWRDVYVGGDTIYPSNGDTYIELVISTDRSRAVQEELDLCPAPVDLEKHP